MPAGYDDASASDAGGDADTSGDAGGGDFGNGDFGAEISAAATSGVGTSAAGPSELPVVQFGAHVEHPRARCSCDMTSIFGF